MKYCPLCEQEYTDEHTHCAKDGASLVPVSADPLIGQVIKDQYRIEGHIGEGGMAAVYRATQLQLGRPVAVKVMLQHVQASQEYVRRFFREARLLSQLNHPNVVSIIDFGTTDDGMVFMVMEMLTGQSLDEYVPQERGLNTTDILDIMSHVCAGVGAAHQIPLIHRDLKPSNVFLAQVTGSTRLVKVLDFGISKNLEEDDDVKTQTGIVMGTPGYMSPEQILAQTTPDTRSDIYALGAILYFLMSGLRPYSGHTSNSVLIKQTIEPPEPIDLSRYAEPQVANLTSVAFKAMSIQAEDRYATADEMLAAIKSAISEAPTAEERMADTIAQARVVSKSAANLQPAKASIVSEPKTRAGSWKWGMLSVAAVMMIAVILGVMGKIPGLQGSQTLTFGMTAAFSGPSEELGREMRIGIETYFRSVNDQGGRNGYLFQLQALDDGYEPERALANVKTLFEQKKVFALVGNTGTPTAKKILPYISQQKKMLFGAFSGAGLLRKDPPNRYVLNYRASYAEETAAMVHYFTEVRGLKGSEIAVFSQNDSFGDSGFSGVEKKLRHSGNGKIGLHVRYERNSTQVEDAIAKTVAKKESIKAIILVSTYKAAAKYIKGVVDGGLTPVFSSVSFVGSRALAERLVELGPQYADGVIVTQVVPYYHSNATGVLQYQKALKRYYPQEEPGFVSLEGYIAANLLVEGVAMVQGDMTTESLITGLEAIKGLDLGYGTVLSFSLSKHQASNKVWGTVLNSQGQYQILDLD